MNRKQETLEKVVTTITLKHATAIGQNLKLSSFKYLNCLHIPYNVITNLLVFVKLLASVIYGSGS